MAIGLLRFLSRETAGAKYRIVTTSLVAGLSRGALLAIFNAAAVAGMSGGNTRTLLAAFVGTLLVYLAATFDAARQIQRVLQGIMERFRLRLCSKLLFTQLRFLEIHGSGDIYAHLSEDLSRLSSAAIHFLAAFQSVVLLVFGLSYLAWLSPLALVAALVTIGAGVTAHTIQEREANALLRKTRQLETVFFNRIHDLIRGFKELKLNRAQHNDFSNHLSEIARDHHALRIKTEDMFVLSNVTAQVFTFALIGFLVFALPAVSGGNAAIVFQLLATVLFLIAPFERLVSAFPFLSRGRVALASVQDLEARLDDGIAQEENRAAEVLALPFETLRFKSVTFRFAGRGQTDEFEVGPIDFTLRRGETVFIVGGNGAGKTTLLKLLTGLYQPASGEILVNGRKVSAPAYQSYREMFSGVLSDFHLFRRLYGVKSPDPMVVDSLLTELGIAHKTRLEGNELTGIDLSSGQRKRLAYVISRLADRQIYVFDEFAADQDPDFRRHFYTDLLPRLRSEGKTVIAVTHDEKWFGCADRVLKMEYGRIVPAAIAERAPAKVV